MTEAVGDLLDFACPRCHAGVEERFYGPCASCRRALSEMGGPAAAPAQRARFEPVAHVVANHVATKD